MAGKPKLQPAPDDAEQSARFIEAAKAAGVDETGAGFERAFERLVPKKSASPPRDKDSDQ